MPTRVLKQFICSLVYMEEDELGDDDPLFSAGLIDSLTLLELIRFVEQSYAIEVTPSQITLDNWDSVTRIKQLIAMHNGIA